MKSAVCALVATLAFAAGGCGSKQDAATDRRQTPAAPEAGAPQASSGPAAGERAASPAEAPSKDGGSLPRPKGEFVARYFGVLPCPGCEALQTSLTFYRKPDEYRMVETYFSTPQGDRVVSTGGAWTTVQGTPENKDATVYQLDPDRPDKTRNYLHIEKDRLRPLDAERREIKNGNTLVLSLQDPKDQGQRKPVPRKGER